MSADFRDLALEHLAADEAALRERVRSVEADADSYRALAQQALQALADLTTERDRQRERIRRLTDENAWLRAELMGRDAGRAA